jgi:hypothetical protein
MPVLTLPEQFGRHRILRRLSEGGLCAVFPADYPEPGQVALKAPHVTGEDRGGRTRGRRALPLHLPAWSAWERTRSPEDKG